MNRRNHPNHATLSHVHILKRDRKQIQREFIPKLEIKNVEDENVDTEKEGQEEGCPEDPDVEMDNIKM